MLFAYATEAREMSHMSQIPQFRSLIGRHGRLVKLISLLGFRDCINLIARVEALVHTSLVIFEKSRRRTDLSQCGLMTTLNEGH